MTRASRQHPKRRELLWIMGDGLGSGERRHLGASAEVTPPVQGYAIWFNRPADLSWISGYEADHSSVDAIYAAGKAVHLIVWPDPADSTCLSPYATGAGAGKLLDDHLPRLVNAFKGAGTLWVTMFTEIETLGSYTQAALVTAFVTAAATIRSLAPQARVGIGLGGYDWPNTVGGTRVLTTYEPAFAVSDFLCTQMMQDGANVTSEFIPRWRNAIAQLGSYGKPVMISHMKLWGTQTDQTNAWGTFQAACLTDDQLRTFTDQGLFAVNLMDDLYCNTPYSQTQVRESFEAGVGQWHTGVGTTALATDAAFAGTQSLKHTYTWPTGDVTVTFDNGPRSALNWSADGVWFGLRVRTTPGLKGARARLRATRGDNVEVAGEWWTLPGGDPTNGTDFFDVAGKFDTAMMSSFQYLSLDVNHRTSPGGAQNIWVDQWTQGADVASWGTGRAVLERYATRRTGALHR